MKSHYQGIIIWWRCEAYFCGGWDYIPKTGWDGSVYQQYINKMFAPKKMEVFNGGFSLAFPHESLVKCHKKSCRIHPPQQLRAWVPFRGLQGANVLGTVPAFSLRALGTLLDDPIRFNQGLNESWVNWFVIVWNHLIPRKMRKSFFPRRGEDWISNDLYTGLFLISFLTLFLVTKKVDEIPQLCQDDRCLWAKKDEAPGLRRWALEVS